MSVENELRTERLLLRRWRPEDQDALVAINADPEVTKYLDGEADEEATANFLVKSDAHWARHDFGHFAVEGRQGPFDGQLLGFAGVAYPYFMPELAHRPELGWRLAREAWGHGFASEAAAAAREDAFERLRLAELISIIHPANRRSRRVAEKLGMTLEGEVARPGHYGSAEVWQLAA